MENKDVNLDQVSVTDSKESAMTDLQIYGISSVVVRLLSKLRKYTILTKIQIELIHKPHQVQPVMREIYQFEETKMVMDIREEFDMFYVYGRDEIVNKNAEMLRENFEQSISFVTTNMMKIDGNTLGKEYAEILDSFADKLQQISTTLASKSIFDENYKLG